MIASVQVFYNDKLLFLVCFFVRSLQRSRFPPCINQFILSSNTVPAFKKIMKRTTFSCKTLMARGIGVVVQQSKPVVYILMTVLTNGVYPARGIIYNQCERGTHWPGLSTLDTGRAVNATQIL